MDENARARAARRAGWPGSKSRLGDADDAVSTKATTPSERVAMVWSLTLDAWAMSGKPLPTYTRAEIPGRVVRGRGAT
jgi:hypothetical protein